MTKQSQAEIKLNKRSWLRAVLFTILPGLIVAGLVWSANFYYDLDSSQVKLEHREEVTATSSATAFTVTQSGTGNIVDFKNATGSVFVINNAGAITTGTWQGTAIATQYGGTGQDWSTTTWGSIPYFSATGTMTTLDPGTSGYFLKTLGAGADPQWAEVSGADNYYGPTIIVAASNSTNTSRAHYQCDEDNDQVQINQAVSDISSTGGTVLLLEGNYFIASSTDNVGINITTSSIALVGSGKGTILHRDWDSASDDGVIEVGDGGTASVTGTVIVNLSIDGCKATSTVSACKNAYTGSQNTGIYFNKKVNQSRIQNTWVHDCDGHGIYLYGTSGEGNYENFIIGNDVRSNDRMGIALYYSGDIISNNNVETNGEDQVGSGGAIYLYYSGSCRISGNKVSSNSTLRGIYLSSSGASTILGNHVSSNDYKGIYIISSDYNSISGNYIFGNHQDEISIASSNYNTITANIIYADPAGSTDGYGGIYLANGDNNIISSNYIEDNDDYGISLNSLSEYNYLIGNEFDISGPEVLDSGTGTTIQQRDWFEIEPTTLSVNYPGLLVGSSDTAWATGTETYLGIAATSTFAGNLIDLQKAGTSKFVIDSNGNITTGTWQATAIGAAYGGTGTSTASWTGVPYITAGAWGTTTVQTGTEKYGPTVIVAASNSTNTDRAHYQCDGTDDQEEINDAISDISSTGGTVLLLEGNYFIASSTDNIGVNITTSSIALIGSGKGTILKRTWNAPSYKGVITVGDSAHYLNGIVIANLSIDGQKATYSDEENLGIHFYKKITQSRILDNWIHDCGGRPIYIDGVIGGGECTQNLIKGNDIRDNGQHGILFNDSNNNIVTSNNIQSNTFYGVYLYGSDNNIVTGNNIQSNTSYGVLLYTSSNNAVTSNNIQSCGSHGIYFYSYSNNNTVTGNKIHDNGNGGAYDGIKINDHSDANLVSSNDITDATGTGYAININSPDCDNNYLIGNRYSGTGASSINDAGTNTTIQQRDQFEVEPSTLSVNYPASLIRSTGTSWATGTETYLGIAATSTFTGNLVDFQKAGTSKFVIDSDGNITTGIWQGTAIATQYGGTGQDWSAAATGSLIFATTTGTFDLLAPGTSGYYLKTQGVGEPPTWAEVAGGANYYGPTIIVAASSSTSTTRAHYQCDGTDDQEEIQAALDALPSSGGQVQLLEGTYYVESSISLDSNQTLRGNGKNTIITTKTADLDIIMATSTSGNEKTGILIADLTIDGDAGGVANDDGILWAYVDYSSIYNVWSQDNGVAGIDFFNYCDHNRIENNTCQGDDYGISAYESDNNTIAGNTCQGNTDEGIYLDYSENNTVTGNICQGNGVGISVNSGDNNLIADNTFEGSGDTGIYLYVINDSVIAGNTCQGSGEEGMYVYGSDNNIIADNTIQGSGDEGIQLGDSDNNTITGNTLTENSQDNNNVYEDIYLSSSDYNNIQGNTCRAGSLTNKPQYGIYISDAGSTGNLVINNDLYDDGFGTDSFNNSGTDTVIYGNRTGSGSDPVFNIVATSTAAALSVTQSGTGNIVEFKDGGTAVFTIADGGNVTVAGDILPATTSVYNLGSDTYKWANLYAVTTTIGDTITIGGSTFTGSGTTTFSTDAGALILNPSGNVGIGTSNTAGGKLSIAGGAVATEGSDKVTNGGFDTDTDWTKGTGWTISGGVASKTAGTSSDLEQDVSVSIYTMYKITFDYTRTAGTLQVELGGTTHDTTFGSGDGSKEIYIYTSGTGNFKFKADDSWAGTIDNASVEEIIVSDVNTAFRDSNSTLKQELRIAGTGNLFFGYSSGRYNTTGNYNTGLGYHALFSNTTGDENTALGAYALFSNITGGGNTGLGYYVLYYNTTGYKNTALGSYTLRSNTTGYENTALGNRALYFNTTGYENTALGAYALYSNTTGAHNTGLGSNVLYKNTTGNYNTGLGDSVLHSNTTGNFNIGVGRDALYYTTSSSNNTAVGYRAGYGVNGQSTFQGAVIFGTRAGYALTTGDNNTLIGYYAGDSITTGSGNIIIGFNQDTPVSTTSNFLNIGGTIYGDLSTDKVGIGTTTPSYLLTVDTGATSTYGIGVHGSIKASGSIDPNTGLDVAERYLIDSQCQVNNNCPEVGDLVSIAENQIIQKSLIPYDSKLIGVVSEDSAITMGGGLGATTSRSVALVGRLLVKILTENGPIEIGDYLTSSNMPGVAMKATDPGRVIGMALEPFDGAQGEIGKIMVFVNLHWRGQLSDDGLLFGTELTEEGEISDGLFEKFVQKVKQALASLGLFIENEIVQMKELITEKITAKEIATEKIELRDIATGEIYCTWLENGEWVKVKGECEESQEPPAEEPSTEELPACQPQNFYYDSDNDGYGVSSNFITGCESLEGYVSNSDDCDDNNSEVNPGASEICDDGIDNNCDGEIDEEVCEEPPAEEETPTEPEEPVCTPDWSCTEWEPTPSSIACGETFLQTRTCTDLNKCGNDEGKPTEEQEAAGTDAATCGTVSCDANLNLVGECQNSCVEGSCQDCIPQCSCAEGFSDCDNDISNGCETASSTCPVVEPPEG
jgi:parallel beta-helix repeat protein